MSWTGFTMLTVMAIGFSIYLLRGKRAARRSATRPAAAMDHDVHERIRAISAESRFSSAGIEF